MLSHVFYQYTCLIYSSIVPRRNLETASESNLLKPRSAISQLKTSSSALTMPKSISENSGNDSGKLHFIVNFQIPNTKVVN